VYSAVIARGSATGSASKKTAPDDPETNSMRPRCSAMMPGLSCRLVLDLTSASIMPAARALTIPTVAAVRFLFRAPVWPFYFAEERKPQEGFGLEARLKKEQMILECRY